MGVRNALMPKTPGIYKKQLKSGIRYYGSAWSRGEHKVINTSLYPTAAEAKEALDNLKRQIQKGVRFDKKRITVKQFIDLYLKEYIEHKQLDVKSVRYTRSRLNTIAGIIGDRPLHSLTALDMQDVQNKLLSHYAPVTVNCYMGEFKRLLKRALIWNYLLKNPMLGLDSVKVVVHKLPILDIQEILRIMYDTQISIFDRCMVGLGGFGGLRISEAIAVRKENVNFNDHTIYIDIQYSGNILKPPKANSTRYIPILLDLEPILKEQYIKSVDWLFRGGKDGYPLSTRAFDRNHFKPLLRKLDLQPVRFHSLRHAFNKMLYDHGIPQREVMQIMGHKPQGMTWRYDRKSVQRCVKVTREIKFLQSGFQNILQNI